MKFRLGPKPVYFVSGAKNMQVILRNSSHLTADELFYMGLRQLDGVAESDINKFKADRTGRSQIPAMPVPEGHDRIWHENHKIFAEYLTRPESLKAISTKFVDLLQQKIEKERSRGWKSVSIYQWLMEEMVECAIVSLSGSYILEMNPGLINAMWEMDKGFFALIMGMPKLFTASRIIPGMHTWIWERGTNWQHTKNLTGTARTRTKSGNPFLGVDSVGFIPSFWQTEISSPGLGLGCI